MGLPPLGRAPPGRLGSEMRTILSLSGVPTLSHEEMPGLLPSVQEEASHLPSAPLPLPLKGRECPLRSPSGTPWRQLRPPSLSAGEAPPTPVIRTRAPEATPPFTECATYLQQEQHLGTPWTCKFPSCIQATESETLESGPGTCVFTSPSGPMHPPPQLQGCPKVLPTF